MAQADPEDEIGYIGAPNGIAIHAGGTDANIQLIHPRNKETNNRNSACETQQYPVSGACLKHGPQDVTIYFCITGFPILSHVR